MASTGIQRKLDPKQNSPETKLLVQQFANKVIGQEKATQVMVDLFESFKAGFGDLSKPVGNALFLGPTGTGKTHVVQTFAEALFDTKLACVRIDCAEFQHSHEIAKLIGSPPGYLGHRETHPALEQKILDKYHKTDLKLSVVLFDEIEKASDSLWALLLGILDNATLTLGDNSKVDFSKAIIIMTSNLGAREMASRDIGYSAPPSDAYDQTRLEQIALSAAKSKFNPEFMNRIQNIVTFKTLTPEQIDLILDVELKELSSRLWRRSFPSCTFENNVATEVIPLVRFSLAVSPKAKKVLLKDGYSPEYGARHIKRAVERLVQKPLSKLILSKQIEQDDTVIVDDSGGKEFDFYAQPLKEETK